MTKIKRWIAIGLLVSMGFSMSGCYGYFPLTRAVYGLNGKIGTKVGETEKQRSVLRQIVFWVFVILPIYDIAILGDAIVFNLIEFWTGERFTVDVNIYENPGLVSLKSSEDGNKVTLSRTQDGEQQTQAVIERLGAGEFVVRDAQGEARGFVHRTARGDLRFSDSKGKLIRVVSADQLARR